MFESLSGTLIESILSDLTEGVLVADLRGRFVFFNRAARAILGLGPTDAAPSEWSEVYGCYHKDKTTPFDLRELPLARAISGETVGETEMYIRNSQRRSGVWIAVTAVPLRGGDGELQGGAVVFRDITAKKEAEEQIQRLLNAVEQTADSIVITDHRGLVEYVNPAFETTTGFERREIVGRTPRVLKSGRHGPEFYRSLWETIASGNVFRGTITNRKKSGEFFLAEQTITPIKNSREKITHFVSVMKDVTEQRRMQEQEAQLRLAREIQQEFYRVPAPCLESFDIAGAAFPANATGGDYFDFFCLPRRTLGICIGDVSGHGFASALLMASLRSSLRALAQKIPNVGKIACLLNQTLLGDMNGGRYVTLMLCRLNPRTRSLVYTSAGHVPGYVLDCRGAVKRILDSTNVPLGLFESDSFECSRSFLLRPGEILVLLTDGITEAEGPDPGEFGAARALEYVAGHREESAAEIVHGLYHAVRDFSKESPQVDDITAIVCKTL